MPSDAQVCILGVLIVFFGLLCLVLLCYALSALTKAFSKSDKSESKETQAAPSQAVSAEIPNKQEFVAAVSAAIAESSGKDISAIRILSIKRM